MLSMVVGLAACGSGSPPVGFLAGTAIACGGASGPPATAHVQVLEGNKVVAERTLPNDTEYNFKLPTGTYTVRAGSFNTGHITVREDETTTLSAAKVTKCFTNG